MPGLDMRCLIVEVRVPLLRKGQYVYINNTSVPNITRVHVQGIAYPVNTESLVVGYTGKAPYGVLYSDSYNVGGSLTARAGNKSASVQGAEKALMHFVKVLLQNPANNVRPGGNLLEAVKGGGSVVNLRIAVSRAVDITLRYFRSAPGLLAEERPILAQVEFTNENPLEVQLEITLENGLIAFTPRIGLN